jgi:beta-glucosidase
MRRKFRDLNLVVLLVLLLVPSLFARQGFAQPDVERLNFEQRVEALLKQMTLEEKVGQLVQYSAGNATGPASEAVSFRELIAKGQLGSLLNVTGVAETNALQRIAMERSRLRIPLLFGLDVIHGYRTIFPVPLGMASTWDPQLVEQASRVAAQEASAEGVRWTFSPMVDIARDARWGRIVEGSGEDTYLGQVMAAAYVHGYQGSSLANPDSIAACVKHFVGYGAAQGGRDYNASDISERTLRQVYLPPFQSAIESGAASVMSAFNPLNGVPASADAMTLTEVLRHEWGFQGFVVSDWNAVGELVAQGVAVDPATAAKKAIMAGVDMDMESSLYRRSLVALVRSGEVPEAVVDEAARRVLRVKFSLGLFDHPYVDHSSASGAESTAQPMLEATHVELARKVAERSLILLRNEKFDGTPLLPIASDTRTIALVGPFADSTGDMLGSWPGKGSATSVVTLKSALMQRMEQTGGRLLYANGTDTDGSSEGGFQEALDVAQRSDLVFIALGESAASMSGEAASRAYLDLPGNQQKFLEAIVATRKPVVLILFSGRPLALPWAAAHVSAIVEAWYPGAQAGPALVRTLFGEVNFAGKLPVSVPRTVGQEPLYYNPPKSGRPAGETDLSHPPRSESEKYVSRYIDEVNSPLFPFGYGLSYTHFSYSALKVSSTSIKLRDVMSGAGVVNVSATVTNQGARAGQEIVELYLGQRGTSVNLPMKELKGFKLLSLKPGESQQVEFKVGREELAFWNVEMHHLVEAAEVTVWIAPDSTDGQSARFAITK